MVVSLDQTMSFHFFELFGQCVVRDPGKISLELIKPPRTFEQPVNDHHRPTAGNHLKSDRGWAANCFIHKAVSFKIVLERALYHLVRIYACKRK